MKNLLFFTALVLIALLTSCQENEVLPQVAKTKIENPWGNGNLSRTDTILELKKDTTFELESGTTVHFLGYKGANSSAVYPVLYIGTNRTIPEMFNQYETPLPFYFMNHWFVGDETEYWEGPVI